MTEINFKGAQAVLSDNEPDGTGRGVLVLADGAAVAVKRSSDPQNPEILFGPIDKATGLALSIAILRGDKRAITDPLVLGTLATAFIAFDYTGRIPSGSAASPGSEAVPPAERDASPPAAPTSCEVRR